MLHFRTKGLQKDIIEKNENKMSYFKTFVFLEYIVIARNIKTFRVNVSELLIFIR